MSGFFTFVPTKKKLHLHKPFPRRLKVQFLAEDTKKLFLENLFCQNIKSVTFAVPKKGQWFNLSGAEKQVL